MKKKITRIIVSLLLLLVALGIAMPFLMQNKVGELLKANVNNRINGQFDFTDMSLSIYKDFPFAVVRLKEVSLVNKEPFLGDTLFSAERVRLKMGLGEFFEGTNDPLEISEFMIDSAKIYLKINQDSLSNYDISLPSEEIEEVEESDESTILSIKSYEISNSEFSFWDATSNTLLEIDAFNHRGSGDLSSSISELKTESEAVVSLSVDNSKYLDHNTLRLDALIGLDVESNTYTFKDNQALVNRLPITFDGFVRIVEEGQEIALSFNTVSSEFKNFLALIPEQYSKDIAKLQTRGNFDLSGHFEGILSEETIPSFIVEMKAKDASFKYPELPKKVERIYIDARIENESGLADETQIRIDKAAFQIDKDTFEIQALITELTGNMGIRSHAKGTVNLNNLSQAYPVPTSLDIGGILQGEISAAFDLEAIENQKYKKVDLSGYLNVVGLNYHFESLPHPLKVHTLNAELGPQTIDIKEVAGITGSTDFSASGQLRNTLGFLLNEEVLKGDFDLRSNSFVIADLLEEDSELASADEAIDEGEFKIPSHLDINMDALVGKAIYDNIVMYDLVGNLRIKDEVITFSEISSRMMDGRLILDGTVSTREEKPTFDLALNMSKVNIGRTFETIELMNILSPAARALNGKLSTKMRLSGNLTDQLDLDINSITGNVLAEILAATVDPEKAPVMNLLDNRLGFVAFDKLDLSGLKTALSVENGRVQVKPFSVNYEDISVQVSGGHSFANALDYQLTFDVPAEYMGDDVNKLLSSINDPSLREIHIPVVANIGGSYDKPRIKTDMKSQTRALTEQLVEVQKQKYIKQGKSKVNELISNALADNKEDEEDTNDGKSSSVKLSEALKQIPQSSSDSSSVITDKNPAENEIKETAKGILGGLLGGKNKAVTAKDTLN